MKKSGFTIIELVVTVAGFTIIAMGLFTLVSNIFSENNKQGSALGDVDTARRVASQVTNYLRKAEYSSIGGYPLVNAGSQDLIFYASNDTDTVIERLHYYIAGNNLYQGVIEPSGSPLTYNIANEKVTLLQKNIANGATPLFYYYDDTYNGVTGNPLTQPVNVTQVKYIKLNWKIYNRAGKAGTNSFTITAGGSIRTLKTNLGN